MGCFDFVWWPSCLAWSKVPTVPCKYRFTNLVAGYPKYYFIFWKNFWPKIPFYCHMTFQNIFWNLIKNVWLFEQYSMLLFKFLYAEMIRMSVSASQKN